MAKYRLSNKAVLDLESIWDYTVEKWSENQAELYFNQIIRTCSEIAKNPNIGKYYTQVRVDLLGFKIGKHIVFYQSIERQGITVFRILHEQMYLENRLRE